MLVLSRKEDDSIRIGDEVTVKVLEINGNKVRLGVEAPGNVAVHRSEVWARIHGEDGHVCPDKV